MSDLTFSDTFNDIKWDTSSEENEESNQEKYVHLRIFKRNARKDVTTIENLPSEISRKKLLSVLKKTMNCNGHIIPTNNPVIQLQGDHRISVKNLLISDKLVDKKYIIVHGY